jgi:S-layer homology domain
VLTVRRWGARALRVGVIAILLLGQTLATPPAATAAEIPTTTTLDIDEPIKDGTMKLTVSVSPVPDGGTFSIHAASGEAVVDAGFADTVDGVQAYVLPAPIAGTGPYTASFSGTPFQAPSQSVPVPWTDDRMPTTTSLEVTPLAGAPFDTWRYRVAVDPDEWGVGGPMEGFARLYVAGSLTPFATLAVSGNGIAQTTSTFNVEGPRVVYAEYSGDDAYVPSRSDDIAISVERIPTTTTLTLSDDELHPDQDPVTATITVSPPPAHWPEDPTAGLSLSARDGQNHFEAVAIDPETGIGTAELTREELGPEIWTARANFAPAFPVNRRYVFSESDPVELRYIPFGPGHELSISPALLYDGDSAQITVELDPVPPGGTLSLYSTMGTVGVEPTLLGTQPANAPSLVFPIVVEQGMRWFTHYSGHADIPASQSAEFKRLILLPPSTGLEDPGLWRANAVTDLEFGTHHGAVQPVTFECSLDGGAWASCTSPYTTPPLSDGQHAFAVRATDGNGRPELIAEEAAWRVDTTPPVLTRIKVGERSVADPLVTLKVKATDQTIGLHGSSPRVHISMSPQLNEIGLLRDAAWRGLGTSTVNLSGIQFGGGPQAGIRSVYVQVEDAFGHHTAVREVRVVYAPAGSVRYTDIAGHRFETDIAWLYFDGVRVQCRTNRYCPDASLTRGQMAVFLDRAFDPSSTRRDFFRDDEGARHEDAINRLAAAGIVIRCKTRAFCPNAALTREQLAAVLDRALDLPATTSDFFRDDESSAYEAAINRTAAAGVTFGCTKNRFCPTAVVTRGQMAAFLRRALDD